VIAKQLPADISSVAVARHFVRTQLLVVGKDHWAAELLVSELVANAIEHAGSEADVTVSVSLGPVRVSVTDGGAGEVVVVHGPADAERGRGMQLVDALAARWGCYPNGRGKTVWFELSA